MEVVILGGFKIGLVELFWVLMNFGEIFLLLDLGYLDYLLGVVLGKVKFEIYLFLEENNFLLDLVKIFVEVVKWVKFIYVNYLNNLIGVVVIFDFYEELVVWVKKYQVGVVFDFVYGVIGFDGQVLVFFM